MYELWVAMGHSSYRHHGQRLLTFGPQGLQRESSQVNCADGREPTRADPASSGKLEKHRDDVLDVSLCLLLTGSQSVGMTRPIPQIERPLELDLLVLVDDS